VAMNPKIRRMLETWEAKHGLDVVEQRLDDGLFSHDPALQKSARAWIAGRKAAPWIHGLWKLLLGLAAIVAAIAALISALK
jgi:hypothetical protein